MSPTTIPPRQPLPSSPAPPPKRKTMSITQTYYLAHSARGKLSSEASRSDHRLRRLVGHANLLDSLMLELADAEAEQESWFNASVRGARKEAEERHIQWADSVVEEPEEDWRVEDAESESSDEEEEEDVDMGFATLQRVKSHQAFDVTMIPSPVDSKSESGDEEEEEEEEDTYEDDGEEDYAMLSLQRTNSHPASPPDLIDEDDSSSSEDEAMPPSPPADVVHAFPEAEARRTKVSPAKGAFFDEGFYLPQRTLVSAVSVY
ncbi:hypothetical protein V493_03025 [Pseudogymnoascus sp. VKM F-4281 (FW-2241)]|nr:hypothetical protein V493_03025 [Pseudogymnoascus sp. VKM F-4281 (FW-2241)]